ncbi:MAG: High-affinity branched-chain amino acid transport system permease protein LivH [Pseudomonadota bacterium]
MTQVRKDFFSILLFVWVVAAIPFLTQSGVVLNFVMMALFACLIAHAHLHRAQHPFIPQRRSQPAFFIDVHPARCKGPAVIVRKMVSQGLVEHLVHRLANQGLADALMHLPPCAVDQFIAELLGVFNEHPSGNVLDDDVQHLL